MKTYTSHFTGNTIYFSDNMLFSSLSREQVMSFNTSEISSINDLDYREAVHWSSKGDCPIARKWLYDYARISEQMDKRRKELETGNYCPLRVGSHLDKLREVLENELTYRPDDYILRFPD